MKFRIISRLTGAIRPTRDAGINGAMPYSVLSHGGMGYAKEFDVERYFRESMIARIAPVSREMILNYISERVLHLPKSY